MIYVPTAFEETERETLHALIEAHSFATFITPDAQDPMVTHLPILLDRGRGPLGTLIGHFARGNPQWRRIQEQSEALVIFHGPHAYVSPSWYGAHPSVPTWNYAVVHARGPARLFEDSEALEAMLRRMVDTFEGSRATPWRMELPDDYRNRMIGGIVGVEIEVAHLTGKFKLSQNRPATDRPMVVAALEAGDQDSRQVAALMRKRARP